MKNYLNKTKSMQTRQEINSAAIKQVNHMRLQLKKECMDELMQIVLPTLALACKDEFKASDAKMRKLNDRLERYLEHLGDRTATMEDVKRNLMV